MFRLLKFTFSAVLVLIIHEMAIADEILLKRSVYLSCGNMQAVILCGHSKDPEFSSLGYCNDNIALLKTGNKPWSVLPKHPYNIYELPYIEPKYYISKGLDCIKIKEGYFIDVIYAVEDGEKCGKCQLSNLYGEKGIYTDVDELVRMLTPWYKKNAPDYPDVWAD